jgi:hypothetical protein
MDENMKKGQKEARIGLDSEKDIVTLINTNKQFSNLIINCLNKLGFAIKGEIKARLNDVKTDIFIEDTSSKIGVSIKSSTKTSFHQLDRRRLEKWKEYLNMPDEIFSILKEAVMRVTRNSKDYFILQEDRCKIKGFFASCINIIVNEIFKHGEQDLKLLIINDKRKNKLYLYKMEEVVNFLINEVENNIDFSPKGIIRLGSFITVQRKGGNGFKITIPKTDWKHPGNQLQFKFSPIKFAESLEGIQPINFQIILIGK